MLKEISVYGFDLVRHLEDDAEYNTFVLLWKLEQYVHSSGFICRPAPGGGGGCFGGCDRNHIFRTVVAGELLGDFVYEVVEFGFAECDVSGTSESAAREETWDAVCPSSCNCVAE